MGRDQNRLVTARRKATRRRTLELLDASREGCTEAIMLAHGFDMLVELVIARLAAAQTERMVAGGIWTLAYGHRGHRTLAHGYEATREAAMTAFAKNWR